MDVPCPLACEGTGYYSALDGRGEDIDWVECPLHHPSHRGAPSTDDLIVLLGQRGALPAEVFTHESA